MLFFDWRRIDRFKIYESENQFALISRLRK